LIQLTPRLGAVAALVRRGAPMADIGTDHAYLPTYLVQTGAVPRAIAGDVVPGPLEAARQTVEEAGLTDRIELRLGDGLRILRPGEATTVTICGMGGGLIVTLLENGPLEGVERLVLQPMESVERVRAWLVANGWRLIAEVLVEDAGRLYVILAAERGEQHLRPDELLVGPHLQAAGGELLQRYLTDWLGQLQRALAGARRSDRPEAQARAAELTARIQMLEEVRDRARGDRP
jgi:tRNA (adenine22-N1)-methyltransferase